MISLIFSYFNLIFLSKFQHSVILVYKVIAFNIDFLASVVDRVSPDYTIETEGGMNRGLKMTL